MKKLYRSFIVLVCVIVGSFVVIHLQKGQQFSNVNDVLSDSTAGDVVYVKIPQKLLFRDKRIEEQDDVIILNRSSLIKSLSLPGIKHSPPYQVIQGLNDFVKTNKNHVDAPVDPVVDMHVDPFVDMHVDPFEDMPVKGLDVRKEEPVNCPMLMSGIENGKSKQGLCNRMNKALRSCLNTSDIGKEPLKNFYKFNDASDMSAYNQYRKANVAFVHLPKAGGTSVEAILGRIHTNGKQILKKPIWHCTQLYHEGKNAKQHQEQYLYFSKRSYGVHNYVNSHRPFAYVTWFREPIGRLVSTFYFLKKMRCWSIHTICKKYVLPSRTLTDYIKRTNDIRLTDFDNFYVRLLQFGDYPDIDDTFEDCCGSVTVGEAHKIPVIEEKHYLIAKRNLEKMAFIGITEDFKTSQDMVSNLFGIPVETKEVHSNANPHSTKLTDWELNELKKRNYWDLKLYEDAKQIYEEQKQSYLTMKEN